MSEHELFVTLMAVTSLIAVITLHTQFLISETRASTFTKFVYPVLLVSSIAAAYYLVLSNKGYATDEIKGEWEYLAHSVHSGQALIILVDNRGDQRLLRLSMEEGDENTLDKARKQKESGKSVMVKDPKEKDTQGLESRVRDLSATLKKSEEQTITD